MALLLDMQNWSNGNPETDDDDAGLRLKSANDSGIKKTMEGSSKRCTGHMRRKCRDRSSGNDEARTNKEASTRL